jgi:hypothetical protein
LAPEEALRAARDASSPALGLKPSPLLLLYSPARSSALAATSA